MVCHHDRLQQKQMPRKMRTRAKTPPTLLKPKPSTRRTNLHPHRGDDHPDEEDEAPSSTPTTTNSSNSTDLPFPHLPPNSKKKRKLLKDVHANHSLLPSSQKDDKHNTSGENISSASGTPCEQKAVVCMPSTKALLFALDKFQKKDTYGVFSEPVDPEELPDYFDIIKTPMDFGTIRKNIEDGKYTALEQLESDVLLVCSNAMTYNAPSTIYYRQARSIQELAKKTFEAMKNDPGAFEIEQEQKTASRIKSCQTFKKSKRGGGGKSQLDSTRSEFLSNTSHGSTGDQAVKPTSALAHEHSKAKRGAVLEISGTYLDGVDGSSAADQFDDHSGPTPKGALIREGRKDPSLEENRRGTYKHWSMFSAGSDSIFSTFIGNSKQLVHSGIHLQYAYARSLARFSSDLGPVAWKIAAKKIEKSLPHHVPFGQGWVGENEAPAGLLKVQHQSKDQQAIASSLVSNDASRKHADLESLRSSNTGSNQDLARKDSPEKESCVSTTAASCTTSAEIAVLQSINAHASSSSSQQLLRQKSNPINVQKDLPFAEHKDMHLLSSKFSSELSQSRLLEIVSRNSRFTQWASSTQTEQHSSTPKAAGGNDLGRRVESSINSAEKEPTIGPRSPKRLSGATVISNSMGHYPSGFSERNQVVWAPLATSSYENTKSTSNQALNAVQGMLPEIQHRSNLAVSNQTIGVLPSYYKQKTQGDSTSDSWSQSQPPNSSYTNANTRVKGKTSSNTCYNFPQTQERALTTVSQIYQQQTSQAMPFSFQSLNWMHASSQSEILNSSSQVAQKIALESSSSKPRNPNPNQVQMIDGLSEAQYDAWKSLSTQNPLQKSDHSHLIPPHLNVNFKSPHTSSKQSSDSRVDSQPDLALQL